VLRAARAATEWAGSAPLIFGGDLNLRPGEDPEIFTRLAEDFGLASPTTGPKKIDHVLVRGLEVVAAPAQWPAERRELPLDGKALRLSDHAPVEARFSKEDPPVLAN
jgi:endonuclease/exonuclease/phosphatase family metal-dependent hydrolase